MKFGRNNQVNIENLNDFYFILGYLSKSNKVKIVWEHNEEQGAWGSEGRILFYDKNLPQEIIKSLKLTKGVENITYRLNCNDFVNELVNKYGFMFGSNQDIENIKSHIPDVFIKDFEKGLKW